MEFIFFFKLFILISVFITASTSLTSLNKFKVGYNEQFGNLNKGCEVSVGVVLQDVNEIKSFSSNVIYNYIQVEKDDLKVYYLIINQIPFGINNNLQFNVINSVYENSTITLDLLNLNKPFNCKELKSPVNYEILSKSGYIVDDSIYYDFNFGYDLLELGNSLGCSSNFGYCSMNTKIGLIITIRIDIDYNSYINNQVFKINLIDSWNQITEVIVETPNFFQRELESTTVIENLFLSNNNNSILYSSDSWLTMLVEFGNLNSQVYMSYNNYNYYPSLAYGTNEKKTFLFSIQIINEVTAILYDAAKQIKEIGKYYYRKEKFVIPAQMGIYKTTTSKMVNYNDSSFNLVFKLNQIQLQNLIQGFSVRNNLTNDIPLPYGYSTNGNSLNRWLFSGEYLVPPIRKISTCTLVYNQTQKTITPIPDSSYPNIILQDLKPPSLHSVKIKLLDNYKILTTLHITDEGTGVNLISSITPQFRVYAFNHLTSGTLNDGIFEIISDLNYFGNKVLIELTDLYGTTSTLSYYINENLDSTSYFIPNLGDISITYFNFNRLEIDTSFDNLDLQLSVKFSANNSILPPPYIIIKYIYNEDKIFFGQYNKAKDLFEINIKVPARENGYFVYSFNSVIFDSTISSSSLELLFPSQKVLLTTNYIDHFPPTIQEIKVLDQISNSDGSITMGWELLIQDFPVGLNYGTFEVNSDADINPITFNIKPDVNVPGSDTLSNYKLQFNVKSNISQNFIISKCKLVDKNGYISQYPSNQQTLKVLNPFMYLGGNPRIYTLKYIAANSPIIQDYLAPILLSLDFESTINSYLPNRTLTFTFSVFDRGDAGISKDHNPWIYIQSFEDYIRVKSNFIYSDSNSTYYYNATIEIPYGFLYNGAIVSIHGITDNNLNVASYLSDDLNQLGLKSSIINTFPITPADYPPVILEFSTITQNGGSLFIYGKNFGTLNSQIIVYCDFNDGRGFNDKLEITSMENVALTVSIPKLSTTKEIKIKIIKLSNQLESNIISIIPIEVLSEVILNCNKLSNCNNQGICINGQCLCNKGWYGLDCSSNKTLETGKPDDDKPTFSFYGSVIEIKQIIETDIYGLKVNEFNLTNWNYKLENQSTLYPNSTSYIYTSILSNKIKTKIQVVISVFNNKVDVNYANQVLKMEKGSIKYTISMDNYDFKSQFNSLKLLIKTSISDTNEKCSFYDYALNNNNEIEWIKLRINSNTTMMGKFINIGVIDYRIIKISNQLLSAPTLENQEAIIGVTIPFYRNVSLLDPDFQVLVDHSSFQKNNTSCYLNNDSDMNNDENNLTTAQLASIITVSAFMAITLVLISSIILKKKIYREGCRLYYISDKTLKDSNLELDIK